jgi:hypothetical protein
MKTTLHFDCTDILRVVFADQDLQARIMEAMRNHVKNKFKQANPQTGRLFEHPAIEITFDVQ